MTPDETLWRVSDPKQTQKGSVVREAASADAPAHAQTQVRWRCGNGDTQAGEAVGDEQPERTEYQLRHTHQSKERERETPSSASAADARITENWLAPMQREGEEGKDD